ncbi:MULTISPECIES: GNAT family N-acetyltransferase [unclassified Vibrio]|uniref:GNAT family N-acetyltransferase n=1 Tax=unclassified Vibrio TaxID=2614977 RepID=UPI001360ECC8|nr:MULTISPECIES: GNAT family N-acetyltransferase [unclassified Vibrio]NAW58856.1 GNAT family N-acetyltransferase [Vibrio sp. V36_P2S2PM302]NAX26497.1 GNAT family N-acetyltransferase [Vibrio sp. V38_P2S17PM301]NAX31377.1 GNAT family N-acetyltransferase [Vibrio sp. V37_P2S8PM304]
MIIREMNKDDVDALTDIFVELERYYFGEEAASAEELHDYLLTKVFSPESGVRVVAAINDQCVTGIATYTLMYPAPKLSGQMYMKDLFVSSAARGQRVGRKIMHYLAALAIAKGCRRLDWTAETTNPSAGDFYRAIGAQHVTEKQYYRFSDEALSQLAVLNE